MTRIIVDPGHGGRDPGAVHHPYMEKVWALDISLELVEILAELNYQVTMTRDGDFTILPGERSKLVRESGADLCISVHINAGGGQGAETIHSIHSSGELARLILVELGQIGMVTRRSFSRESSKFPGQDHYYMHRNTGRVETIIVEYGFIDNQQDRELLNNRSWRKAMAQATAEAIQVYQGNNQHNPQKPQGKVELIDQQGEAHQLKEEQVIFKEGRWYIEGRTLASLLQGRASWDGVEKKAVFDFTFLTK